MNQSTKNREAIAPTQTINSIHKQHYASVSTYKSNASVPIKNYIQTFKLSP